MYEYQERVFYNECLFHQGNSGKIKIIGKEIKQIYMEHIMEYVLTQDFGFQNQQLLYLLITFCLKVKDQNWHMNGIIIG